MSEPSPADREITGDDLMSLLPALYRLRDADNDGALGQLLEVFADQIQVLQTELDGFYDDQFIETGQAWVAPYIGDLIGYRPMFGVAAQVASPRADVANTIRYRRRKGTALMLEQLARDVTDWPAREVEFFELIPWAQFMNHLRPAAAATPDLRGHEAVGEVGTAFDDLAHVPDVRRITTAAGFVPTTDAVGGPGAARHNIGNIGIFLWRIGSFPLSDIPLVDAAPAAPDGLRFRFDPLNRDLPIFSRYRPVESLIPIAPADVPAALGRRFMYDHLDEFYGTDSSVLLTTVAAGAGTPIPARQILISDLSDLGTGWAHRPATGFVAIDPVLGRVYLGDPLPAGTSLHGSYHYGEAIRAGAGSRDRGDDPVPDVTVSQGNGLPAALAGVAAGGGLVAITDSRSYGGPLAPTAPAAATGAPVSIRAVNLTRPTLDTRGSTVLTIGPGGRLVLDGLLISGGPLVINEVADNEPRSLILRDCTLVPGGRRLPDGGPETANAASLIVLDSMVSVTLERCQVGPIVAVEGTDITLIDCVIDADDRSAVAYAGRLKVPGVDRVVAGAADELVGDGSVAGGRLALTNCTVIGGIHADILDASNCLLLATLAAGSAWPAAIWAHRRQQGCVRFSWLPVQSRTGRRFGCQPDGKPGVVPTLTSMRFGDPAYCQLAVVTPSEIRRGADDDSEMGVTHGLFIPLREANLRIRLTEYLRFGLQVGCCYAS